jgi:HSP20 family protein
MSLIPWKPFSDLDRFFNEDDWFFPVFSWSELSRPALDLKETDKEIIVEVEVPGFDPEKIDIKVEQGVLRIAGKMDEKEEEKEKGYWRKEIRRSSFERVIRLPVEVKEEEVEATYDRGVLKISIPKAKPKAPAKVKIKVKENKK